MKNFKQQLPLSSLEERLKHTPKNRPGRGHWTGQRGNSLYFVENGEPELLELLKSFKIQGIEYRHSIVDFLPCVPVTVYISNMSAKRYKNFALCDQECAKYWNSIRYLDCDSWTRHIVSNYRKNNNFTWHERNDRLHCDLVPTKIHAFFLILVA